MAIVLKYWNGRGLMEVPRMLLAISGKFPGDGYEDMRCSAPPDCLEKNLGRMPIASIGDRHIGNSVAINFWIASECGLMGSDSYESAEVLCVTEHLKEMMQEYGKLVPYGSAPTEENLNKWFEEGATDHTGPADGANRANRFLNWWMGRIEAVLGNEGFAVGNKLSLADVLIYYYFYETLADDQAPADFPQYRKEPFCSKARTDAILEKFPKFKASCLAVANNENIQKWRAIRGPQGF